MTNTVQPLVSVVVSCYNHAAYIEQCLLSILEQDYPQVELLVVDDGSKDDSVSVISRLQAVHGFYFNARENKGLTKSLNELVAKSNGEFVIPLGSDDVMLPGRISAQVSHMLGKPEVGICGGNIELIDEAGKLYPESRQNRYIPFRRMDFEDVFLERKPYVPATTLMIRKTALLEVGGFDEENNLEDLMIELKITRAGYFIDCLAIPLGQHRKHKSNSSKNIRFMTDSILDTYKVFSDHPDYLFVKYRFLSSMFLKMANRDKSYAFSLLKMIPFKHWNKKTWRGLVRLFFSPLEKG